MLSWGEAFWKAFVTVLYTLGWAILGGIIIGLGFMSLVTYGYGPYGYYGPQYNGNPVFFAISLIIGVIIIGLGELATVYRFVSKMIVESTLTPRVANPISGSSLSDLDNLTKLKTLFDSGALTEAEYNQQKKKFLS